MNREKPSIGFSEEATIPNVVIHNLRVEERRELYLYPYLIEDV